MISFEQLLKLAPQESAKIQINSNPIRNKKQSLYQKYILENEPMESNSVSDKLQEIIALPNLYLYSTKKDSFLKSILLLAANKYSMTDQELVECKKKLAMEMDEFTLKRGEKTKGFDMLLQGVDLDKYECSIVRKYCAQYFDLIILVFDKEGSLLEFYSSDESGTEESKVAIFQYDGQYHLVRKEEDEECLLYGELDHTFEEILEWKDSEGALLYGLYNGKDVRSILTKVTVTELRIIAERYGLSLIKPSERSTKQIKKSKTDLYEDLSKKLKYK